MVRLGQRSNLETELLTYSLLWLRAGAIWGAHLALLKAWTRK